MFREMRRFKQQIPNEKCIEILKSEKRGILSLIGDDGYPYGIPLSHYYDEKDGKLYFHGAKEICTHLVQKFTYDQAYLEKELANALSRVQCFVLTIEHMTGKLVNES